MYERYRKKMVPAYNQLAEDIGSKIKNGELKLGEMLLSENQLCAQYGLSRATVRRGLSLLVQAGYLQTVQGKGCFITRPKLDQLAVDFLFSGDSKSIDFTVLKAGFMRPSPETSKKFDFGDTIIFIKRLLNIQEKPIAYDCKYLPYIKGKPLLETVIEYAELPEMVEMHTDIIPVRSEVVVSARMLTKEEADFLQTEINQAALLVEQKVFGSDDRLIGWGEMVSCSNSLKMKGVCKPF